MNDSTKGQGGNPSPEDITNNILHPTRSHEGQRPRPNTARIYGQDSKPSPEKVTRSILRPPSEQPSPGDVARNLVQSTTRQPQERPPRPNTARIYGQGNHPKADPPKTPDQKPAGQQPAKAAEEPLPTNDPIDLDTDWFENHRDKQPPSTGFKERFQAVREKADKIFARVEQQYPKTAQTLRLVGKFAREEGRERLEKAGARQLIGLELPGWGNAAMAAYDTWDTYKDLRAFIAHARSHPELNPSKLLERNKPFHEIVTAQKEKAATKLENKMLREVGKAEYNEWTGQFEYLNQDRAKGLGKFSGMTPTDYKEKTIAPAADKIRHAPLTLEEKLSMASSKHPSVLEAFRQESAFKASEYEKMAMKDGGAKYKYHWLLQQAEKELGQGYFNSSTNPKGALAFERFAAEHLEVSGFARRDIEQACSQGISCTPLSLASDGKPHFRHDALTQVQKHFEEKRSVNLGAVREDIEKFHLEKNAFAGQYKLTKEEVPFQRDLQEKADRYAKDRNAKNIASGKKEWENYQKSNGQSSTQSPQQQFLLEYGKRAEVDKHQPPHLGDISYMMHAAGHREKDIIDTLQQYHPDANQSERIAEAKLKEVLSHTERSPLHQQEKQNVRHFKEETGLQEEKRLDRLPFDRDRTPYESVLPAHTRGGEQRPVERNDEIER